MLDNRSAPMVVEAAPAPPAPVAVAPAEVMASAPPPAPTPPKMTPKPVVVVQPVALKRSPVQVSNPADGVVVRRNVVINVGAGQPPVNGTINPGAAPASSPPTRPRAGAHYSVRDGGGFVSGNRARATEGQSQPLASSRDIRMPWETPGPSRISQPIAPPTATQMTAEVPSRDRRRQDPDALGIHPLRGRRSVLRRARLGQEPRRGDPRVPRRRRRTRSGRQTERSVDPARRGPRRRRPARDRPLRRRRARPSRRRRRGMPRSRACAAT